MRTRCLGAVIVALVLVYSASVVHDIAAGNRQHDFATYYYAPEAYFGGLDPYNTDILSYVAGEHVNFDFVYPPYTLYLLRPLLVLDYKTSYLLFLFLKVLALLALVYVWWRSFLPEPSYAALLLVFCALAYDGAVFSDLSAGNISVFEQLFIWLGVLAFLKRRPEVFTALVVASALFKPASIILLLLPLLDRDRRSAISVAGGLIAFSSLNLASYALNPALYGGYLKNAGESLYEYGSINPSSLIFIKDVMLLPVLGDKPEGDAS